MCEENITCIGCPLGCRVFLNVDKEGKVRSMTGIKCKEGEKHVVEEFFNPKRILTATLLTEDSRYSMLPVKTSTLFPKKLLADAMKALAVIKVKPPVKSGDVIFSNLLGTGVDIVATADLAA